MELGSGRAGQTVFLRGGRAGATGGVAGLTDVKIGIEKEALVTGCHALSRGGSEQVSAMAGSAVGGGASALFAELEAFLAHSIVLVVASATAVLTHCEEGVEELASRAGEAIVGAEPAACLAARVAGDAGIGGGEVASGRAINHAHVGVGNDAFGRVAGFTIIGIRPVTRFAFIRAGETLSAG